MTTTAFISNLETDRLSLEPLEARHAAELFPLLADPALHAYMDVEPPPSLAWLKERYSYLSKRTSGDGKQLWLNWVPRHKTSGTCVGYLESTVEDGTAFLAYYVFGDFQGQGYAKEGLQKIMDFLATAHAIDIFVIEADTRNLASACLAQALGFRWVKTTDNAAFFKGHESHEFRFEHRLEPEVRKIRRKDLRQYVRFRNPGIEASEWVRRTEEMERNFTQHSCVDETVYVAELNGRIQGAVCALRLQPSVFGLANLRVSVTGDHGRVFFGLVRTARDGCRALGGRRISLRLAESPLAGREATLLALLGFGCKHERIEFRKNLSALPCDDGSPIAWEQPDDLSNETFQRAARAMAQAAQGDPDYDPSDDAEEIIRAEMRENGLTSGQQCIHFARIDGRDAGIVIAQVNPSSGWSRISYMGLFPEFRLRGLGAWVHRHGFTMLRGQGGSLYHGGTLSTNIGMLKLFERHGCERYRTLREWESIDEGCGFEAGKLQDA